VNYLITYVRLMRKAQTRQIKLNVYEKHHVFPKSIYGKNNYVVELTPREHYIAHALLYKALAKRYGPNDYRSIKMTRAFLYMHVKSSCHYERHINSKLYERLRTIFSESIRGERHPMFGRSLSIEARRKISIFHTGKITSEETRRKMSKSALGKTHSERARRKVSEANTGRVPSEQTRRKLSEIAKGRTWYTDGKESAFCFECPEGYYKGRTMAPRRPKI